MSTYLFVTKPEYTPERVESGFEVPWWSCSKTTECGDRALVYVTGMGILYEWRVISDAEPDEEWKYICDVEHARTFAPPITLREICAAVTRSDWAPPHLDFRGYKSIRILVGGGGPHPRYAARTRGDKHGAVGQISNSKGLKRLSFSLT